jgi:hypothetical protein
MRKFVLVLLAGLGLLMASGVSQADFGGVCPGGYAHKAAFWARSNKCGYYCSAEEERWQKFWHDYYHALHCFYKKLDKCDWVIYYKYHGYNLNGMGGGQAQCAPTPVYAPVTVTPMLQWASHGGGAGGCAPAGCGHGGKHFGCHKLFGCGGYGAGIYGSGTPNWCPSCGVK